MTFIPFLPPGITQAYADTLYAALPLEAADIVSGQLALARGGTNADLSATGGATSFLRQASAGAAITVGAIASADLTTALTTPPAIGGTTPAAGAFTTVTGTGAASVSITGTSTSAAGVRGNSTSNYGVHGVSTNSYGVYGTSTSNIGIFGNSTDQAGVRGSSTNNTGVIGTSTQSAGMQGSSTNAWAGYFQRNTASPLALPVFYVIQDHASDTNPAALIRQDGTGDILRLSNAADATVRFSVKAAGLVTAKAEDAATNTTTNILTLGHNSSGTPAASFGAGLPFQLESSTTADRNAALIEALWQTATDASRASDLVASAYYTTTKREGVRIRGGASDAQIGFLGATPVSRASHIADPSGGATTDAEARTAINAILVVLENLGFVATS